MKAFVHDLATAILVGLIVTCWLCALLVSAGLVLNDCQLRGGLMLARSGMLIAGSFGLFFCAGLLLRPRSSIQIRENPQWKQRFHI